MKVPEVALCGNAKCESDRVLYMKKPDGFIHYGEFTCAACGRHLAWVSKMLGCFLDRLTIAKDIQVQKGGDDNVRDRNPEDES